MHDHSTSQVYVGGEFSEPFSEQEYYKEMSWYRSFCIIFIIVIDYISKLSADDFGYKTHKTTSQPKTQRTLQSRASREDKITDQKLNDLALVDYIALLENDKNQAQLQQLSAHQQNAAKIGLDINVDSINPT